VRGAAHNVETQNVNSGMQQTIIASRKRESNISSTQTLQRSLLWNRVLQVWLLVALVGFVVHAAIVHPIEEVAHDAAVAHIYRGVVFSRVISDGIWYPRWAQDLHLGLGGPLLTFQPPLPFYALDFLYRLGIPHPFGWRVLMATGFLAAAAGMFLFVHHLTRRLWPSLVAAVAFVYAPYVIRNAFDRGSNEVFSLFLYPWVLWGLLRVAAQPSPQRFALAALLWALCIGSHVLGPLMLAPVVALAALVLAWRYRTPAPPLALLAGGLLMAFVWLPIVPEIPWVHLEWGLDSQLVQPASYPIPLDLLLAPPAVFDVVRGNNAIGDRVGWLHLLFGLLGVPVAVVAWRRGKHHLALWGVAATGVALLVFWLLTQWSTDVWILFDPILQPLEFRMRLMGLLALALALLGGAAVALLPARAQPTIGAALVVLLIVVTLPSLYVNLQHRHARFGHPITMQEVRAAEIQLQGNAFTSFGENTPRWLPRLLDASVADQTATSPLAEIPSGVQVSNAEVRNGSWDLNIQAAEPTTLTLNLLYYPRWRAAVDGQPTPVTVQVESGYAQVAVPAGTHSVTLRYARTTAEWAGLFISGSVLLLLIVLLIRSVGNVVRQSSSRTALPLARIDNNPRLAVSSTTTFWLLPVLVTAALAFKIFYVDPHTTWFRCVSAETHVCGADTSVDIPFVGGPRLRGYSVPSYTIAAGERMRLSLIWQAEPNLPRLRSFVHIRNSQPNWPTEPDSGSEVWTQENHDVPGGILTTNYLPGRLYREEFWVPIPKEMPPGEYLLEIGWTNVATGEPLDILPEAVPEPYRILWRSLLLPSVKVE
jgi:hypothetical protein